MSSGTIQITRLGTVVLGVWNGTAIDRAYVTGLLYTDISGLSTVAHTGAYSDLSGTPSLAPIATSGSATDLSAGAVPAARMPALTGDITTSVGTVATSLAANAVTSGKIAANAVTLAKLATQADQTILGNNTGGVAVPLALTAAQTKTLLAIAYTDVSGLATVAHSGAYSDLSGAPSIPAAANPTGSVGLSAVNGSASSFMRSDGAPALSQSIAPTWTGLHAFSSGGLTSPIYITFGRNSSVVDSYIGTAGATSNILTGSAQGDLCIRGDTANLLLGTGTAIRMKIATSTGAITINTPGSGVALTINGIASGSEILKVTDGTVSWGYFSIGGPIAQWGVSTNHALQILTNSTSRISIAAAGAVTVAGTFAINGGTPATKPTGYGTPSGSVTASLTSSSTAAQVAGTLAALLLYLKGIGFLGA